MKTLSCVMVASGGQLRHATDKDAFKRFVASLEDGTEWQVTVKPKPRRQGTQTMRYYRGVVVPDIAEACGYSDPEDFDSVHESLAWKFLRIEDHPQFGYPRRRSTAKNDLSADEMSDFVSKCIEWAEAEIVGCRVRRPNEVDLDSTPMVWQPNESEAA